MKSGIYCIKNIVTNKVYIGKSVNVNGRISSHKWLLKNNKHVNTHLQNAWNKYGKEFFEFKVIEYYNQTSLPEKEEYWVNFYKSSSDEFGYNLMKVGRYNHNHSTETKQKMSIASLGKKKTIQHRNNFKLARSKAILQFDKQGNFIQEWIGASFVRDTLGFNQAHITSVCNNKRKSANGFIWKYKN